MKTPYNTGKVRIGSAYVPKTKPYHDRDALRLQDALLGNKPQRDWDGAFIAAVVVVVVFGILTHFWSTI